MVWQEKVNVVVKVTREIEDGTLKCHRYWPDAMSEPPTPSMKFGLHEGERFTVTFASIEDRGAFLVRNFKLTKGDETRTVSQLSYESWPDHGVPLTSREFLEFREAAQTLQGKHTEPIVVHCSAGIGRSGTFIALDSLLQSVAAREPKIDPDAVINSLRANRMNMVQTAGQYEFVWRALLAAVSVRLEDLTARLSKLQRTKELAEQVRLSGQLLQTGEKEVKEETVS